MKQQKDMICSETVKKSVNRKSADSKNYSVKKRKYRILRAATTWILWIISGENLKKSIRFHIRLSSLPADIFCEKRLHLSSRWCIISL